MTRTASVMTLSAVVLGIIYLVLLPVASNGYGYMGYGGYYRGPSFWYWDGPEVYHDRSTRSGSVSGTSRLGGGPGSGK